MVKIWPSSSLQAPSSVAFLGMVPLVPLPRLPRPRPARPPSLSPFPRPALAARAISLTLATATDGERIIFVSVLEEFTRAAPDTKIRHLFHASVDQIPMVESMVWSNYSLLSFRCFYTSHTLSTCLFVYSSLTKIMAKNLGKSSITWILVRIQLQPSSCSLSS